MTITINEKGIAITDLNGGEITLIAQGLQALAREQHRDAQRPTASDPLANPTLKGMIDVFNKIGA